MQSRAAKVRNVSLSTRDPSFYRVKNPLSTARTDSADPTTQTAEPWNAIFMLENGTDSKAQQMHPKRQLMTTRSKER
jgi:hypothetical protein